MIIGDGGYYSNPNLWICKKHVDNPDLRTYIEQHGSYNEECFFCGNDTVIDDWGDPEEMLPFDQFVERVLSGITHFYDDPANGLSYDSKEGGYLGEVHGTHELLNEIIGLDIDYEVIGKLVESIVCEAWTDANFYRDSESDSLIYTWERFSNIVKHQVRYFFFEYRQQSNIYLEVEKPAVILEDISNFIIQLDLIVQYPNHDNLFPNNPVLYRARQHSNEEAIDSAQKLGSAPVEYAAANRFSAEGISMFYGAGNKETAIKEVISRNEPDNESISVGKFTFAKPVHLIDLREIVGVGMFDIENLSRYEPSRFLMAFVQNISKRIGDSNERIEYIPSQVVTEYLHYVLPEKAGVKIDGLIYKSAIDSSDCYAIFANNFNCANSGSESENSILILDTSSIESYPVANII